MTLQTKIMIVMGGLLLAAAVVAGVFIRKYIDSQANAAIQASIIHQNEVAYQQQLTLKADSLQILAVSVASLNANLTKAQKKAGYWQAMAQNLQVQLDSLHSLGSGVASSGEDSTGKYAQVSFGPDLKDIAMISGFTRYYFTTPVITRYTWDVVFLPILLSNSLYQDTDGLWKIRSETKSPGVRLLSSSTIDSTVYVGMRQAVEGELAKAQHYLPPFGLRGRVAVGAKPSSGISQFSSLLLDCSAEAFYKNLSLMYYPVSGVVSVGATYTLDVASLIERIF